MKYVAPAMRDRGGGAIINTSSVAGLGAAPDIIAYCTSKHAVVGTTKWVAVEWARHNTRVNAVCPAPIETRMMRSLEHGLNPDDPEAIHQALAADIPMGWYGELAEVAALVVFLASRDALYSTGGYTLEGGSRTWQTR